MTGAIFRTIRYLTRASLEEAQAAKKFVVEPAAQNAIKKVQPKDILALRVRISSPPVVEDAAPLSGDGLRAITQI